MGALTLASTAELRARIWGRNDLGGSTEQDLPRNYFPVDNGLAAQSYNTLRCGQRPSKAGLSTYDTLLPLPRTLKNTLFH
jgi:hypothetical protein